MIGQERGTKNFAICFVVKVSMLTECTYVGLLDSFEYSSSCMVTWLKDLLMEVTAKFAISSVLVLDFCVIV